jgi:outer membrane receptor for ferrienterochelin and colicins
MNKHALRPLAAALALAFALPALADKQLGEVTVSSGRSVGAKPVLRDEIVATESIGARELEKTGATMLTEALDKRPGISVQTECSICNVRNVVLNNLPGRYTTLLIDGIPIFSSVSTAYGLDSVNLGGIERIDISRGAGSSLIAPEALAGSVNIVTRRPLKDEFMANQQFGSFGQWNTDLFGAKTFTGGALTANFNHNQHDTVDGDGNGVLNTPASSATWAASASSSTTSAASSSRAASTWSTKSAWAAPWAPTTAASRPT